MTLEALRETPRWPKNLWANTHAEKQEINPMIILARALTKRRLTVSISHRAPDPYGGFYPDMVGIHASPQVQKYLDQVFNTSELHALTKSFWHTFSEPNKEIELKPEEIRDLVEQVVNRELR